MGSSSPPELLSHQQKPPSEHYPLQTHIHTRTPSQSPLNYPQI